MTRAGGQDAGEHLDGGGLTGAVLADVADQLARLDHQIDTADRLDLHLGAAHPSGGDPAEKGLAQVPNLDCGHVQDPADW